MLKGELIPDTLLRCLAGKERWGPSGLPLAEELRSYQLVGEVTAHQGEDAYGA